MSFSYTAMSEQEAMNERFQLLKDGIYDAVVTTSQDKTSVNSGNPMMDMTLSVYDKEGNIHQVRDFLVFTKSMMWKVVHCAESADLVEIYNKQKFCSEAIIGKPVKVKVTIEEGSIIPEDKLKGKMPGSRYPNKNKIEDYVKGDGAFVDSDMPF